MDSELLIAFLVVGAISLGLRFRPGSLRAVPLISASTAVGCLALSRILQWLSLSTGAGWLALAAFIAAFVFLLVSGRSDEKPTGGTPE